MGLFIWPMLIPAVVDGVGSANANQELDRDFEAKGVEQLVIQPYSQHNGVIFVPLRDYQDTFRVILVEKETKDRREYQVRGFPAGPEPIMHAGTSASGSKRR